MPSAQPAQKGKGKTLAMVVVVLILAGAFGAYFVLNGKSASSGAHSVTANIPSGIGSNSALNYSPHTLTLVIGVNNTVNFVNQDSAIHTVTANDMSFNSADIAAGSTWTHTFSASGTFSFHCIYHTWMTGTIIVKSA